MNLIRFRKQAWGDVLNSRQLNSETITPIHLTGHRIETMRHVGWRSVWRCHGFTLKLLLLASFTSLLNAMAVQAQQQAPELLTYQELVQLYEQETPPDALQNKLRRLLTTPFVSNEAAARV